MNPIKIKAVTIALLSSLTFALSTTAALASDDSGMSDGTIIAIYNQVNTFDIETAGIGIQNAKDPKVLSLAKMVQTDHTKVRQMAADLAIKLGEDRTLPASRADATLAHAKVIKALGEKQGAAFDRAYLKHEIAFHAGAIDAINQVLIPAAKSQELVELMESILPGFEHHLAATKKVAKELGYQ